MIGKDGWIEGIHHVHSPHYAPRPDGTTVTLVVIHSICLPEGEYGGCDVADLFTGTLDCRRHPTYASLENLRVSAHFFIRRDGQMTQFVSCQHSAWHAGASLWRGKSQCNDFSIGIELEGTGRECYSDLQYQCLTDMIHMLTACYPIMAVVGHNHIAPHRKQDPGPCFDWSRLFRTIGNHYDGRT